jgi:hypothetical protein
MSERRELGLVGDVRVHGGDNFVSARARDQAYPRIPSSILAKSPPPRCPPVVLVKRLWAE